MTGVMSSVGRLMSVASRRGRLASLRITHRVSRRERLVAFLRLVSRFVHRFVFISRLVLSCRHSWREAVRVGRGVDVLVVSDGVLFPCF